MNATTLNTLLHCLRQIVNLTHAITEQQQQQQLLLLNVNESAHASKLLTLNTTTTTTSQDHNAHVRAHAHDNLDAHDDHAHDHNDDSDGLLIAKLTAILVLFLASAFCGSLPFLIESFWKWNNNKKIMKQKNIMAKNNEENNTTTTTNNNNLIVDPQATTIVKCLLYFGGGVLLCTTFVHLLPEVQESVEQLTECQLLPNFSFPLAEVLMCIGFFLMYFIEEIIHTYIHYVANKKSAHNSAERKQINNELNDEHDMGVVAFERGHSIRRSCLLNGSKNYKTTTTTTTTPLETTTTPTIEKIRDEKNRNDEIKTISTHDLITYDVEQAKYNDNNVTHHHQHHNNDHHHHHSHYHGHSHNVQPQDAKKSNRDDFSASLRGLFIVLALSIHELFEGMAIGLEHSTSSVWVMFGAVSAHKLVLAFCVGVELIVARTKLSLSILYIFTFAIVSPLGIGIGIMVSSSDQSSSNVVSVYLQGLACGTLLYVVFFEILSKNYAGLKALFALIAGFCIMFGLRMLGKYQQKQQQKKIKEIPENSPKKDKKAQKILVIKY